jgi:hypothetical protein
MRNLPLARDVCCFLLSKCNRSSQYPHTRRVYAHDSKTEPRKHDRFNVFHLFLHFHVSQNRRIAPNLDTNISQIGVNVTDTYNPVQGSPSSALWVNKLKTIRRTPFNFILLYAVHIRCYSPYTTKFIFKPTICILTRFLGWNLQKPIVCIILSAYHWKIRQNKYTFL